VPKRSGLTKQREDLLAEIATGNADETGLPQLDKALKEENLAIEKAKANAETIVGKARQAIAGLQRKLFQASADLKRIEENKPEVLLQFFLNEAAIAYMDYQDAAKELSSRFGQLQALSWLIRHHAPNAAGNTIEAGSIIINVPNFNVADNITEAGAPSPRHLIEQGGINLIAARETEVERLRNLGVTLI